MPKLSIRNRIEFPTKQKELELYPLQEVLTVPIIPFMTICELPVGGQKSIQGNICHVPVDVDTTVNNLQHTLDDMQTISVKLKCKKIQDYTVH